MAQNNQTQKKKIPERRCVGCGEHFPKSELVRVLRTPEGEVVLDLTGKKSGRGAYICKKAACLKKAQKSKRIESSLECSIPQDVYQRMEEEISHG
jgi:predicted RNA-binding protein YlxR (DUF448 family)